MNQAATPTIVERTEFDRELDQQVAVEKELTRFGDRCRRGDDACR